MIPKDLLKIFRKDEPEVPLEKRIEIVSAHLSDCSSHRKTTGEAIKVNLPLTHESCVAIKRLYDELQEKSAADLAEKDEEIARLRAESMQQGEQEPVDDGEAVQLREENDRLKRQLQLVRKDYDAKIERLNARIRELSGGAGRAVAASEPEPRKGFFRR